MNDTKPIWLRKPKEVNDEDYNNFYKSFSKVSLRMWYFCQTNKFELFSTYSHYKMSFNPISGQ